MPYIPSEDACLYCGKTDCRGAPAFKGICEKDPLFQRAMLSEPRIARPSLLGFRPLSITGFGTGNLESFEVKEAFRPFSLVCKAKFLHSFIVNYIRVGTYEMLMSPVPSAFFSRAFMSRNMVRFDTLNPGMVMRIGLSNLVGYSVSAHEAFAVHGAVVR